MARVFRAEDTTLHVPCAVKLLDVPDGMRDQLRARLRAEAHAMALVQHPNVLRVIDVGTEGAVDWIAMDLAPGGSLEDRFEAAGPLPPSEAAELHADVLDALQAAHDAGVIHRDVKPSNLLVGADGRILLADFGIAQVADNPHVMRSTRTGMTMGTMAYMAPEQRMDARGVTPAADQYAVAASLYWLVTGWNPIDLFAAAEDSARWERLPAPLRAPLFRATRYEPTSRFPTAAAMAEALRQAARELPEDAPAVARPARARTPTLVVRDPTPVSVARPLTPTDPDAVTALPVTGGAPAGRRWTAPVMLLVALFAAVGALGAGLGLGAFWEPAPVVPAPVARPTPAPPPGPSPAPAPAPAVVVAPAPVEVAPADRPVPRPAPAPEPAPELRAGPIPLGRWSGSFRGRPSSVELTGSPEALAGTVRVRFGQNEVSNAVTGAWDSSTRTLTLRDVESAEDAGTYRARLSPDDQRFQGSFEDGRGQKVPFVWSR